MQTRKILSWLCCSMMILSTLAAPVSEKNAKEAKDATEIKGSADATEIKRSADAVEDQEKELESLVALAEKPAVTDTENIKVHQTHFVHVDSVNGKERKTEQNEERISDTESGKVLSDIKQEIETGKDETGNPKAVVQTKIDIPDKGVHKTFMAKEDLGDEAETQENLHGVEFTPTAVAEYLMRTWDFDNFYKALEELVDSSVMTKEDAAKYEENVIREYQRISSDYSQYRDELPAFASTGFDIADEDVQKRTMPFPDDLYNEYYRELDADQDADQEDKVDLSDVKVDLSDVQEDSFDAPQTMESALDELLEDWWVQAFEAGEPRAQALVKYLYDIVGHDNNPDDMGQIREILAEMLANALIEDLSVQQTWGQPELGGNAIADKRSQIETPNEQDADTAAVVETPSVDETAPSGDETPADEPEENESTEEKETEKSEEKTEEKEEKEESREKKEDKMAKM